jgi:hypothetical protein
MAKTKIQVRCTHPIQGNKGTEKKIEKLKFDSVAIEAGTLILKTKDGFCVKLNSAHFAVN